MQSNRLKKIITLFLTLTMVLTTAFAIDVYGVSRQELESKKQKIQQEINDAEKKVNELAAEKKETQDYVAALDTKIQLKQDEIDVLQDEVDAIQAEIDTLDADIAEKEARIEENQKEIDAKQAEFDETFDEYCQRLRAMYVSGSASNIEVLLTCPDISSILTRSQMIKSVSEQDSAALDALMTKMSEIEAAKAELEADRIQLQEDKDAREANKATLEEERDEIETAKAELKAEVDEANALIKKLGAEQSEYLESISDNKAEQQKIESEIQAIIRSNSSRSSSSGSSSSGNRDTTPSSETAGSGNWIYPTSYHTVSGGYPNYASGRYHGALDFPCPVGTSVYAVDSGTVLFAGWHYSYGNYVLIDHGGGVSSIVAHNSSLAVSTGQHVTQGQVVAYSGSTGNSTGPHVHLEARVNGQRVNPYNYL